MASRNQLNQETEEQQDVETMGVLKPPISNPKQEKIIAIDGDSITWIASYTGKDEFGNKKPEYTEEEYSIAEGIADEIFMKIVNTCEEFFKIKVVYLCLKGNCNNPRYKWFPEYKAHRLPPLPIIKHLHNYLANKYSALLPTIGETDDLIAEIASLGGDSVVICSFDKDIKQLGNNNWFLNYKKWEWEFITKEEADYLFNFQMIVNDPSDNIKFTPKVGEAFAKKAIKIGMTPWEYFIGVYSAYLKAWKNEEIAREKMYLAWKLLKLHTIEEFKNL